MLAFDRFTKQKLLSLPENLKHDCEIQHMCAHIIGEGDTKVDRAD